jgi:hypothetical protein
MRRLLSFAAIALVVAGAVATDVSMQTPAPAPPWTSEPFLDQFAKRQPAPAAPAQPGDATPRATPIARIVDIMRVINSDDGVRGRLAGELGQPPQDSAAWERARSDAAIIAEAGNLLLAETAPRGSADQWRQRATDFRASAQELLQGVTERDLAAAQRSLREMPATCAACHADFR